jgi:osmoprotectant transport system permease protein
VNFLSDALGYIFTASHWTGNSGLGMRIGEHLQYTVIAVLAAVVIAVPMGLLIGHTGRGTFLVVSAVNALRALPTLGVLLLGVLLWGLGLIPPTVALLLLGVPPLLAGTYSGIANVDRTVVEAARAMGMTERQVLFGVEVPNALPLILSGLRTATLQIVATATVAAYASLGGLGRYLIDGIKVRQFHLALVGALLVTALALLLDAILAFAVWLSAPGTGRLRPAPRVTSSRPITGRRSAFTWRSRMTRAGPPNSMTRLSRTNGGDERQKGLTGAQFARSPTVDG